MLLSSSVNTLLALSGYAGGTRRFILAGTVGENPHCRCRRKHVVPASDSCVRVGSPSELGRQGRQRSRLADNTLHTLHGAHFQEGCPCARDDAIAASLDSTGSEDEVSRSLRLTAVLRTLNSRSPLPLHLVKPQANSRLVFF